MYYYGGNNYGCSNMNYTTPLYPMYTYGNNNNYNSTYAIILVLFILLVIVIGTRYTN